jgi:hypothetical protein
MRGGGGRRQPEQECSFLKKRTKKLLSVCASFDCPSEVQTDEVFFASFFFRKKKTYFTDWDTP